METKTQKLRALWNQGEIKKSLKIFKTFKIGITSDQKEAVEIAYECLTGKENFYISLGINTDEKCRKAKEIVSQYLTRN